jgi:putative ATP-dependent endonuclease of OLD family
MIGHFFRRCVSQRRSGETWPQKPFFTGCVTKVSTITFRRATMRISRVQINNFRNFKNLDVQVGRHLVIVGENKVGKSNFLHALRLLLDPSLPDSARRLRIEDFLDGAKPLNAETCIRGSVDLSDFQDNQGHLAILGDYLVGHSPMIARLTYVFFPKPDLELPPGQGSHHDSAIYGKDDPSTLVSTHEVRKGQLSCKGGS